MTNQNLNHASQSGQNAAGSVSEQQIEREKMPLKKRKVTEIHKGYVIWPRMWRGLPLKTAGLSLGGGMDNPQPWGELTPSAEVAAELSKIFREFEEKSVFVLWGGIDAFYAETRVAGFYMGRQRISEQSEWHPLLVSRNETPLALTEPEVNAILMDCESALRALIKEHEDFLLQELAEALEKIGKEFDASPEAAPKEILGKYISARRSGLDKGYLDSFQEGPERIAERRLSYIKNHMADDPEVTALRNRRGKEFWRSTKSIFSQTREKLRLLQKRLLAETG